jgi:hypothetical protein
MGSAEFRKYLTQSVYGVMSGKTISNNLADKINRISMASEGIDAIVRAAKAGDRRRIEAEMEKLMDDDAFMEAMNAEIPELATWHMTEEKRKEDIKGAAALKAAATRKAKKQAKESTAPDED